MVRRSRYREEEGGGGVLPEVPSSIYRTRSYMKLEHQKIERESASNHAGFADLCLKLCLTIRTVRLWRGPS